MSNYESLAEDIERIQQVLIIPTILDVVCKTTGMGYAAVARVTQDRWVAACVKDDINFGLGPGGELKIETTLCNEVRTNAEPIIINHVATDKTYYNHHTPAMYGFQSYISIPIFLKGSGEFFGTLCAIDPNPNDLNNEKVIGMFNLFADLIAFHLQGADLISRSSSVLLDMNRQLTNTVDENRQYQYISNHNLQEPLRKIRLFSDMLVTATENKEAIKAKDLALKMSVNAQRISMMISDLSSLSDISYENTDFERVDLNKVVADVYAQFYPQSKVKEAAINVQKLPSIRAINFLMEQLFYHLIDNAIKFSKPGSNPSIKIYAHDMEPSHVNKFITPEEGMKYVEICVEDHGIGIDESQLEKIFDIFSKYDSHEATEGFGFGLAYCRKITRIHRGAITAKSKPGEGTSISLILPVGNA